METKENMEANKTKITITIPIMEDTNITKVGTVMNNVAKCVLLLFVAVQNIHLLMNSEYWANFYSFDYCMI